MAKPVRRIHASSPADRKQAPWVPPLTGKLVNTKTGRWEFCVSHIPWKNVLPWSPLPREEPGCSGQVGGIRTSAEENKPECCEQSNFFGHKYCRCLLQPWTRVSSRDEVEAVHRKGCAGPRSARHCCLAAAAFSEPAAFFFFFFVLFSLFALICGSYMTGTAVELELASTDHLYKHVPLISRPGVSRDLGPVVRAETLRAAQPCAPRTRGCSSPYNADS